MFQKSVLVFTAVLGCSAFAHGNRAHQAQEAVHEALEVLQRDEPKETLRAFKSVSAEMTGHELFHVMVGYEDGHQLMYNCGEDESVDPVVWKCVKQ